MNIYNADVYNQRYRKGDKIGIKFAGFGVYRAWQFAMYNVRKNPILKSETLMCTQWIKRCETCFFQATLTIQGGPNGLSSHR